MWIISERAVIRKEPYQSVDDSPNKTELVIA
jgi:hypothetical protein